MRFRLFPPEFSFYDLFDKQVSHATEAARLFKEQVTNGSVDVASVERMRDIEHCGDEAAHTIIDRLNRTFVTPFDREDIYSLTKELDDVIDMLYTIVRQLYVYRLHDRDKHLIEFSAVIDESVGALARSIRGLRNLKDAKTIMDACVEIHRLENVSDSLRDGVLVELFESEKDPIVVIKKKEIYEDAETVLDICEDVANIVESILVKQA